jgi:predicted DNA-binding transcriptional regulator AlpA
MAAAMTAQFLSMDDLVERWGVKRSVIYGLRHRRKLPPAIKIGKQLRWRRDEIEAWEEDQREMEVDVRSFRTIPPGRTG